MANQATRIVVVSQTLVRGILTITNVAMEQPAGTDSTAYSGRLSLLQVTGVALSQDQEANCNPYKLAGYQTAWKKEGESCHALLCCCSCLAASLPIIQSSFDDASGLVCAPLTPGCSRDMYGNRTADAG